MRYLPHRRSSGLLLRVLALPALVCAALWLSPPRPAAQTNQVRFAVVTTAGSNVPVKGTTVEQPPAQGLGGGLNSALVVALAGGALAPPASVNVQFVLGVEANGRFRFLVNVEALTGATTPSRSLKYGGAGKLSR